MLLLACQATPSMHSKEGSGKQKVKKGHQIGNLEITKKNLFYSVVDSFQAFLRKIATIICAWRVQNKMSETNN